MKLIDIGVNLTNKRLLPDVKSILQQAAEVGVTKFIVTGTSIEHSKIAIDLCNQFPGQLFSTCGVHPHDAKEWNRDTLEELNTLISQDCVRAIGETGLDFNRDFSPRKQQIDVFQQQLELAVNCNKPVFLHQRDAFDTFFSLLREYRDQMKNVVVHCFTDNKKALYKLLDLDCHIGITGWISDERRGQELQILVKDIPENRLMLETDAPYLLPRDLPEKPASNTNLPKYLPHILHTVARLQHKKAHDLADEILSTTQQFFEI
ncbi:MAG: TatD family hydrolase [Gammaproteobacteria bacterium]|nr:TatD family hydrolase [Gammaproteobacteria bacterium]